MLETQSLFPPGVVAILVVCGGQTRKAGDHGCYECSASVWPSWAPSSLFFELRCSSGSF